MAKKKQPVWIKEIVDNTYELLKCHASPISTSVWFTMKNGKSARITWELKLSNECKVLTELTITPLDNSAEPRFERAGVLPAAKVAKFSKITRARLKSFLLSDIRVLTSYIGSRVQNLRDIDLAWLTRKIDVLDAAKASLEWVTGKKEVTK